MRKIIFLLITAASISSCKKESVEKPYAGSWEFAIYIGYPFNEQSLPPGNGKIIVLDKNGSFSRYQHDVLIFKGSYSIESRKDCGRNNKQSFFHNNDSLTMDGLVIDVRNDSLFLSTPSCFADGGTTIYRRKLQL